MKVHFLGIGGVGMAGLAVLMRHRGHSVSGCDIALSPRTEWLQRNGITVFCGHDAAHVADADLVVATPAVDRDCPEFRAAKRVEFRGEVLAREMVALRLGLQSGHASFRCLSHGDYPWGCVQRMAQYQRRHCGPYLCQETRSVIVKGRTQG